MVNAIVMPKMGLTMTEGIVSKWLKKEGDVVKEGEALFEVETDKLVNEIESSFSGTLLKIVVPEGESTPCTATIAYIGDPGEEIPLSSESASVPTGTSHAQPSVKPAAPGTPLPPAAAPAALPQEPSQKHHAQGYIPASPAAKQSAKERGIPLGAIPGTSLDGAVLLRDVEGFEGMKATPLAAKIAKELGIDLNRLSGQGRIMSEDVLLAACNDDAEGDTVELLSGMRKTISCRMRESWQTSPRVCYTYALDCTAMKQLRESLQPDFAAKGVKLSFNHIILYAAAKALTEFPAVNASLDEDRLAKHKSVNIGLAVGLENGLLVPSLKGCERLGLMQIAKGTEEMIARAHAGKTSPDELSGGTFTITNLGMYGVKSFSPIINQPELAILGVSAIIETPMAVNGAVAIRPMMDLCLVADHRVIDGVLAARFAQRLVSLLETPTKLLL